MLISPKDMAHNQRQEISQGKAKQLKIKKKKRKYLPFNSSGLEAKHIVMLIKCYHV